MSGKSAQKKWKYIRAMIAVAVMALLSCEPEISVKPSEWSGKDKNLQSNKEIFGYIKDLTSFGYRRTGTPAGKKSAEYIRDRFRSFGLKNVELERYDTHRWEALEWKLAVDGTAIDSFYMPNTMRKEEFGSFSLGPRGLSTEIVYVGEGSDDDYKKIDVKNKIVLCDIRFYDVEWRDFKGMSYFTHDPGKTLEKGMKHENPYVSKNYPSCYYRAQKNGAAAFVGVLVDYFDRDTYYNEDLSLSSEFGMHGYMKIPGLYLSRSQGQAVKNILGKNIGTSRADMKFSVKIERASAWNAVGYIPGKSKDIILIHSHHDTAFTGAVQDASGVAVVLAMAKYFAQAPASLRDKTLLFATLDSHFFGYTANKGFIKKHTDLGENIILDVCVEHVGLEAKNVDGRLEITDKCEPRGLIISENEKLIAITKNAVVKNNYGRFTLIPTFSPLGVCSDAFYIHKAGVPVVSLISAPLYIYDTCDTLDMVAVDELNPTAATLIDIVEATDNLPPEEIKKTSLILPHRITYYWWLLGKIVEMVFG